MRRKLLMAAVVAGVGAMAVPAPARAFCGFYVAKADTRLFNKASKVVVARKGERTVVTMASDYQGEPSEFALVVPVPVVVRKQQIHVTENALVDHLDAYSAPRLVEYFDPDPCRIPPRPRVMAGRPGAEMAPSTASRDERAKSLGVKIEAEYTVGEYDILLLSATESDGLATWLTESGYKIPAGAAPVLGSYIKQGMKFFVARVNLKQKEKLGFRYLRPIQVAYETEKFMLPIRLGTVNAEGPQELFIFMLTERGRVETTNYRTQRIPTNINVPIFTKTEFPAFYKAMFDMQVKKDDMRTVHLEYAWNMAWCDPCAADPVPNDKLIELGAFWLIGKGGPPPQPVARPGGFVPPRPQSAYITRLHLRYDREHFPEDLMFQETADTGNFQGRYVLRHPFTGKAACQQADVYRAGLQSRFAEEAQNLARLTGWDINAIRAKMSKTSQAIAPEPGDDGVPWYEQMWQKGKKK